MLIMHIILSIRRQILLLMCSTRTKLLILHPFEPSIASKIPKESLQENFIFFLRSDRGPHPAGFNYVTPQLELYNSP